MDNILQDVKLTNAQIALIIAEKVTGTVSGDYKREKEVISSAETFLKWLEDKQITK